MAVLACNLPLNDWGSCDDVLANKVVCLKSYVLLSTVKDMSRGGGEKDVNKF